MSQSQTLALSGTWSVPSVRRPQPRVALPRASRAPSSQSGARPSPAFDHRPHSASSLSPPPPPPPPRRCQTAAGHLQSRRAPPSSSRCIPLWQREMMSLCSCVHMDLAMPTRSPVWLIPMLPTGPQVYLLLSSVPAPKYPLRGHSSPARILAYIARPCTSGTRWPPAAPR